MSKLCECTSSFENIGEEEETDKKVTQGKSGNDDDVNERVGSWKHRN